MVTELPLLHGRRLRRATHAAVPDLRLEAPTPGAAARATPRTMFRLKHFRWRCQVVLKSPHWQATVCVWLQLGDAGSARIWQRPLRVRPARDWLDLFSGHIASHMQSAIGSIVVATDAGVLPTGALGRNEHDLHLPPGTLSCRWETRRVSPCLY